MKLFSKRQSLSALGKYQQNKDKSPTEIYSEHRKERSRKAKEALQKQKEKKMAEREEKKRKAKEEQEISEKAKQEATKAIKKALKDIFK